MSRRSSPDCRVVVASADNVECLKQRNPGLHHRRELSRKQCDIFLGNLAASAKFLFRDLRYKNALASQGGVDDRLLVARCSPRTILPALFLPVHRKVNSLTSCLRAWLGLLLSPCCPLLLQILVLPRTSSREVSPCITFSNPERRRSLTPSLRAWSAISREVPLDMMMRWMDSVIGITR